jgi:hypothetical protein
VRLDIGQVPTFVSATGRVVQVVPAAPPWSTSDLSRTAVLGGDWHAFPGGRRAVLPTWDGTRFDLGYVIDVMRGHEPVPLAGPAFQAG